MIERNGITSISYFPRYSQYQNKQKMKTKKITPSIIRSAKIQTMTPEAFVSGLTALQASINRSKLSK